MSTKNTGPTAPALSAMSDPAAEAAIHPAAKALHLPTVRDHAMPMAEAAAKQRLTVRIPFAA